MLKCEKCIHKKICIDGANYKNAEACRNFVNENDVGFVKHGHWTEIDHSENFGDYHFVCSECKCNTPDRAYVVAPDFCPNCGAKMDGGEGK